MLLWYQPYTWCAVIDSSVAKRNEGRGPRTSPWGDVSGPLRLLCLCQDDSHASLGQCLGKLDNQRGWICDTVVAKPQYHDICFAAAP